MPVHDNNPKNKETKTEDLMLSGPLTYTENNILKWKML